MPDIVVTEFMDEPSVAALANDFSVIYDPDLWSQPARLATLLSDCRGLIVRNRTQVRAALLDAAARLRVVGSLGVGLDNIDMTECAKRQISVCPAIGANEATVAEYVIAAIIVLLRRGMFHRTGEVLAGTWPRMASRGSDAMGKCLGIVGFGGIGRAVAKRAYALGMKIVAYDRYVPAHSDVWSQCNVKREELEGLLEMSDVVTLHVPLTDETRHIIDAAMIRKMKIGAMLINTARGGVVDEAALVQALREGRLGGAMIDVFEHEPVQANSVFVDAPHLHLHLTAHIAGYSDESNARQGEIVARGVREALHGRARQDAAKHQGQDI